MLITTSHGDQQTRYDHTLCHVIRCYTMLYYAIRCYAIRCYTMLYYAVLCFTMLYYYYAILLLCYTVLYYALPCYTIHTILYLTMLCYTILCCSILYCNRLQENRMEINIFHHTPPKTFGPENEASLYRAPGLSAKAGPLQQASGREARAENPVATRPSLQCAEGRLRLCPTHTWKQSDLRSGTHMGPAQNILEADPQLAKSELVDELWMQFSTCKRRSETGHMETSPGQNLLNILELAWIFVPFGCAGWHQQSTAPVLPICFMLETSWTQPGHCKKSGDGHGMQKALVGGWYT